MYSSTLSLTSALDRADGEHYTSPALPLGNNLVPNVKEAGWAPGLAGYGQSGPH
jgi:hypothetical protein